MMARTDPKSNNTTESSRDVQGHRSIYSIKSLSISTVVAVIAVIVMVMLYEWLPS